jgi:hypothetical protein
MEQEGYIVAWTLKDKGFVDGYGTFTDDWERFDNYEDAKLLYDELLRNEKLFTASMGRSIRSTG